MGIKRRRRPNAAPRRPPHRPVARREFDRLVAILNERTSTMNALGHDLEIQFKRMAQMQSELDELRRTIARIAEAIEDPS
jgi:hypothetical protein